MVKKKKVNVKAHSKRGSGTFDKISYIIDGSKTKKIKAYTRKAPEKKK